MYKIYFDNRIRLRKTLIKCVIQMKIIAFFIMATFVHVHAATYGQNVTLDFENASLSDVLNEIQKQTGYDFLYNSSLIKGRNTITIKTKNTDLKRVLADVLSPQ